MRRGACVLGNLFGLGLFGRLVFFLFFPSSLYNLRGLWGLRLPGRGIAEGV